MSLAQLAQLYTVAGLPTQADGNTLRVTHADATFVCEPDPEWTAAINDYFKAKQYAFDVRRHALIAYKSVEIQLVRLSPVFVIRSEHEYSDAHGGTLRISLSTHQYCLAYMLANSNLRPIDLLKRRLESRAEHRTKRPDGTIKIYRFEELVIRPYTARYSVARKIEANKLEHRANVATKSSLFKLAQSDGDCFELREAISPSTQTIHRQTSFDTNIPNVVYNDDIVKYYKVAKSSVFPNQQFLSYYHVLEYFFLRVSDELLHTGVKAILNSPAFNSNYENVVKLIATLKKHDNSSDETEMLKSVLTKFVDEEDLISFISELEKLKGERTYSDNKKKVFGQAATISLQKGHALHATARIVKAIRNALVHSSDKYNREDCFLPLSESEIVVREYVPLVRYLAERVIYATASGA